MIILIYWKCTLLLFRYREDFKLFIIKLCICLILTTVKAVPKIVIKSQGKLYATVENKILVFGFLSIIVHVSQNTFI